MVGDANFDLSELAGSLDNSKVLQLKASTKTSVGICVVRLEKLNDKSKNSFTFDLRITDIPKFHFFSSKNSYIRISKQKIADRQLNLLQGCLV